MSQSYSQKKGIHLTNPIDGKIINEGDLITREKSNIYVIDDEHLMLNCSNCSHGAGKVLLVCTGCRVVSYCNRNCQKIDWKRGHKFECSLYNRKHVITTSIRLFIRVLIRKHLDPSIDLDTKPNSIDGAGQRQDFRIGSLLRLSGESSANDEKLIIFSQIIASVCSLIGNDQNVAFISSTPPTREMMHLLNIIDSNVMALQFNLETVGRVLFLSELCFLNHSCLPNAAIVFYEGIEGVEACLRCVRRINPGDEIVISYINVLDSAVARQNLLFHQYRFNCDCLRCSEGTDDFHRQTLVLQSLIDNSSWEQASFLAEKLADRLGKVFGSCFPEVALLYLKSFKCRKVTTLDSLQLLDIGRKAHSSLSKLYQHIGLCNDLDMDMRILAASTV